jgi:alpha 1,2-mannosyltransferase
MKPAIVYLAQNSTRDTQYGRDSRTLLEQSLDLLYKNYNNRFKHDILIFHEGDFKPKDQEEVAKGRKEIQFQLIHFAIPDFLPKGEVPEIWGEEHGARYGMGHRHMIRFYAVSLFHILNELGYDWFFRMDDDSFIHSPIEYNLFEFMVKNGYEYGYRVDVRDAETSAHGFGEAVLAYVKAAKLSPTFLQERLHPAPLKVHLKNLIKAYLMKVSPNKRYKLIPSFEYDLWGYYNNFFITPISFWMRKDVQEFINHFDRLGGWYKYRWNDLIFQSAAVQIFLPREKLYKFTDWTYEHATIKQGKLFWGGIYAGDKDKNCEVVRRFQEAYPEPEYLRGRSF